MWLSFDAETFMHFNKTLWKETTQKFCLWKETKKYYKQSVKAVRFPPKWYIYNKRPIELSRNKRMVTKRYWNIMHGSLKTRQLTLEKYVCMNNSKNKMVNFFRLRNLVFKVVLKKKVEVMLTRYQLKVLWCFSCWSITWISQKIQTKSYHFPQKKEPSVLRYQCKE